jgi:hypothetical protein
MIADSLDKKIQNRPKPEELIESGILVDQETEK